MELPVSRVRCQGRNTERLRALWGRLGPFGAVFAPPPAPAIPPTCHHFGDKNAPYGSAFGIGHGTALSLGLSLG